MKKVILPLLLASLPVFAGKVNAQVFPEGIDYVVQLQSSAQTNSNPGLLTENRGDAQSSTVLVNTLGVAAFIPLLSRETRLDIAGTTGDARFSNQPQFDYRPRSLDARLRWRAGRLFSGYTRYQYNHARYQSDRIWPESDTTTTRQLDSVVGLNISEDLTLPMFRLVDERTRYGKPSNQQLFDRDEQGWEVSGRYQRSSGSSFTLGWRQSHTTLPKRHMLARTDLDDAYRDREMFTSIYWQYSVKSSLYARAGWLQRRYANFTDRDTALLTLDTQAIWRYSPKTELRLGLWQRPYYNDENPDISHSTHTGVGLTANWSATPKLKLRLQAAYESQEDTRFSNQSVRSPILRLGSRLTWKASRNLDVILDAHLVRKRGDAPWNRYAQNVLRVGIVLYTDNGNEQVGAMLNPAACGWAFQEASLCP